MWRRSGRWKSSRYAVPEAARTAPSGGGRLALSSIATGHSPNSDIRRSRSSSRGLGRSVDLLGRSDHGLAEALSLDQRLHGLSVRVDALPQQ